MKDLEVLPARKAGNLLRDNVDAAKLEKASLLPGSELAWPWGSPVSCPSARAPLGGLQGLGEWTSRGSSTAV